MMKPIPVAVVLFTLTTNFVHAFIHQSRTIEVLTHHGIGQQFTAAARSSKTTTIHYAFWDRKDTEDKLSLSPVPPSISAVAVIRRNLPVYVGLVTLGILPLIDYGSIITAISTITDPSLSVPTSLALNVVRTSYFGAVAMTTVYLGAQRQDIGMTQAPVTGKSAVLAPVFAGSTLFLLYALIKYTEFNPGTIYQIFACLFGWICLAEISQGLLSLTPLAPPLVEMFEIEEEEQLKLDQARQQEQSPLMVQATTGESEIDRAKLRASGVPAAVLSTALVLIYFLSVSNLDSVERLRTVATSNNYIATAIALVTLGQIALESYIAGASLLVGLFFYDALSVFKSDTMVTVATKIEAPVKFLFAGTTLPTLESGKYPFGVLGLGDIVIPGIFLAMLREFDVERWYNTTLVTSTNKKKKDLFSFSNKKVVMEQTDLSLDFFKDTKTPYFSSGMVGYAVGLGATFFVLYSSGQGQPALFYIVPSLLVTSLGTAAYRKELPELWSYKGARANLAREAQEKFKKERDEEKLKQKENDTKLKK